MAQVCHSRNKMFHALMGFLALIYFDGILFVFPLSLNNDIDTDRSPFGPFGVGGEVHTQSDRLTSNAFEIDLNGNELRRRIDVPSKYVSVAVAKAIMHLLSSRQRIIVFFFD